MEALERDILAGLGVPDPYRWPHSEDSMAARRTLSRPRRAASGASRGLRALFRRAPAAMGTARDRRAARRPARPPPRPASIRRAAFQTLRVDDVMTPRADIVAVDRAARSARWWPGSSRPSTAAMPIYRETLDEPVGVVHIKDVFKLLAGKARRPKPDGPGADRRLQRATPLYVPASMRAADLLTADAASRTHMALVIDEFGGTDGPGDPGGPARGAWSGEIDDEHDEATVAAFLARARRRLRGRRPRAAGGARGGHAAAATSRPPDLDEEIDTVGGLVTALAGRVPQRRRGASTIPAASTSRCSTPIRAGSSACAFAGGQRRLRPTRRLRR